MRIIKVLKTKSPPYYSNSARDLYWKWVQQFNNEPVVALEASVYAKPPSQPKKGRYAGKTEPLKGWLNFFEREGLIKIDYKEFDHPQWFRACPNCGQLSVLSWKQFKFTDI